MEYSPCCARLASSRLDGVLRNALFPRGGTVEEQLDIFKAEDPTEPGEASPAWTVSKFNEQVKSLLKSFGTFRIQGFVSGFDRSYARQGHVYFDLQEREDETEILAQVRMILWRGKRNSLLHAIKELGPSLDGQEVFFRVRPDYYVPGGSLSLIVEDIDLEASLGAQKLDRDRVLRKLREEGLLEKNSLLDLPELPLKIGLITSLESAAWHDFLKEIEQSGLAFRIRARDARVQGEGAEPGIVAAIEAFGREEDPVDVLVLIRGGGSRGDLAAFDREGVARAIAHSPLPVLSGIGHEIDRSIADEVAHRSLKTPTAVAAFLVDRVEHVLRGVEEKGARIVEAARFRLLRESEQLTRLSLSLRSSSQKAVHLPRIALSRNAARLRRLCRPGGQRAHREALNLLAARLKRSASRSIRALLLDQENLEGRLNLLDPKQILQRGFSMSYDESGRLLRSAGEIDPGSSMTTRLADGSLLSEIRETRKEGDS
ncbi:MAG: exodeoxyribonuclease VII large subunit [Candidatus Krumholzibacteria bacterium]|nr:exodeoxyribonuclease VII large subunit [Candidatus Krumholzibacteria bacterium]MDP7021884.1 exodeoxyribonuclease VII large subunit [Candidatus Krumholzibacteria bacterium]